MKWILVFAISLGVVPPWPFADVWHHALRVVLDRVPPPGRIEGMIDVRSSVVCMRMGDIIADSSGNEDALHAIDDALGSSTIVNNPPVSPNGSTTLKVSADPASASRRVWHSDMDSSVSAQFVSAVYGVRDGSNDPLDERPSQFWFEMEYEYTYVGSFTTTSDQLIPVQFNAADGDGIRFRLRGGSPIRAQLLNNGTAAGGILPAIQNMVDPYTPSAGKRYVFRLHWTAESSVGGDGTIRVSLVDLDTSTLLDDTTVASCGNNEFDSFNIYAGVTGGNLTAADIYVDHVTYSASSAPGDMDSTSGWFESYKLDPPRMGAMRTDPSDPTSIQIRAVAIWPEAEIGVRNGATTKTATFQYKKASEGSWTSSATGAITVGDYGWVGDTISGLAPNTSYNFRVNWDRDSTVSNSSTATLTTLSASSGAPATSLKLGFYSCISPSKHPVYPAYELANLGAQEIACMGDFSYTNTDMGYNAGSDYLAFNNTRLGLSAAVERGLEWHRLLSVQYHCPPNVEAYKTASHWMFVDDHLFRDDLAGALGANTSGDNLTMIQEIRGFVEDSNALGFYPSDAGNTAGEYWWSRETAKTLTLFVECRQKADHSQTNAVSLPTDSSGTPWAGEIETGTNPFNRDTQANWGTTVMGTDQYNDLLAAVEDTTKPLVIIATGVIVANGSMREYQDLGAYPEIWQILQACEDNPRISKVIIVSHDLHLAMFVPGENVPSAARMAALGLPASYPKLIGELMVGGGGQGGHRLRWQCGNTVDNDGGLRGGTWNGASSPRSSWASDANSNGAAERWDWDDSDSNYDGTDASGTGNTSKQERATLLTIDEATNSLTYQIVNVETGAVDYTGTASFTPKALSTAYYPAGRLPRRR